METASTNKITQNMPLWCGKIVTPVKVTDLARERSFTGGKALWDTGSEVSIISRAVAEACHLKPIAGGTACGLQEEQDVKVGVVLMFPGDVRKFIPISVALLDMDKQDVDVVIGMDIIARGDFSILRKDGCLEFSFVFGNDFMDV